MCVSVRLSFACALVVVAPVCVCMCTCVRVRVLYVCCTRNALSYIICRKRTESVAHLAHTAHVCFLFMFFPCFSPFFRVSFCFAYSSVVCLQEAARAAIASFYGSGRISASAPSIIIVSTVLARVLIIHPLNSTSSCRFGDWMQCWCCRLYCWCISFPASPSVS